MDFFHCNNCYVQPGPPLNKKFWLTNCGHSFCHDCINTSDPKCKACLNDCKYMAVNDMPADLKQLFSDPVKELKKAVKILSIQNKHCQIYMEEYVPKLESKYVQAKMVVENNKTFIESAKKAIENKNAEIQLLRSQIDKLKTDLENERKKNSCLHQQQGMSSPTLISSPSSFGSGSNQEGFFTPKSGLNTSSKLAPFSFNFTNRQNNAYSTSSPFGPEKRKLTALELLFKNKEASVRNSPGERTPRTPGTRSNQTFNMSINVKSPDSCNSDDSHGSYSDAKRMPSPLGIRMRNNQRSLNEINSQRRNSGIMSGMSSPASFKSANIQRPSSELGRKFF
ncbi:unnamed protein product [Nezara viridula]|uniref:RING-type domain-containing protein n=1 Tax=Nezara viridula TaxID=85310 RepID=A0A9P0HI13_NEZVI|nr:unnamed protein product [Nezara viridula]